MKTIINNQIPTISEDENYIIFDFMGVHGEIQALFPKSEERKTCERIAKQLIEYDKTKIPPVDSDLAHIVSMSDVNYHGVKLSEEEKQKTIQFLDSILRGRN